MRERKYRTWNGSYMEYNPKLTGHYDVVDLNEALNDTTDIFMQYTGLKDKNGREIYEGDVVENNDYKWQITWEEGCVYLKGIGDTKGKWWIGTENPYSEIIGNIYENPELIK